MDKKRQMIEYMIQDLVGMLSENAAIEYDEAMRVIYSSEIYNRIMDVETELYKDSPAYVYGLLQDELNFGHIIQAEI